MKKRLQEDTITNELKGRSAFFLPRTEQESSSDKQSDIVRTPERLNTRTDEQANTRTRERPNARTENRTLETPTSSGKRVIKRQSYNVFQDQHDALKRLEATSILSGKGIFISEMVRAAIDAYLKDRQ